MPRNNPIMAVVIAALGLTAFSSVAVLAQSPGDRALQPLTGKVPLAPPLPVYKAIVKDQAAVVALGKALFWDTQVASANNQACASCHFHAGGDTRTVNQLSPGLLIQNIRGGDVTFGNAGGRLGSGNPAGPNVELVPADFPFHRLADPSNRESFVEFDMNDVASSQGAFEGGPVTLEGNAVGRRTRCESIPGAPFAITGSNGVALNTRKVEPRNTPTMINAAYNYRNFWDGRANNVFNGVNPFGRRAIEADPTARVFRTDGSSVAPQTLALPNMSAASQAVGPVLSSFEMTCQGKKFADVGRRLMQQRALQGQEVAASDSVFSRMPGGSIVSPGGGLKANYRQLVRQAFQPAYWDNNQFLVVDPRNGTVTRGGGAAGGYQLDELNFAMFFGLAVDAYERTLISDQTPFDRNTMTANAQVGQSLFTGKGSCISCHDGPLFSKAATFQGDITFAPIEHMPMNSGPPSFYDHGFYNTGVRPAFEDIGVGGTDPFGNPLSFTRQLLKATPTPGVTRNIGIDQFQIYPCQFEIIFDTSAARDCNRLPNASEAPAQRIDVDAAFKTPGLRNIALTAPYMHNGGLKSLEEVMEFYNRGGDRRSVSGPGPTENDTTGTGPLGRPLGEPSPVQPGMGGSNVHLDVKALHLTAQEQTQLVEFMKALTDPRVACHAGPFDHPSLTVANGQLPWDLNRDGNADDRSKTIPAVGAAGYPKCSKPGLYERLNAGTLFNSSAAFNELIAP